MKYGISDAQLQEIINFIKEYPEVEEAALFGSRAVGTYKEASDVDIALKGEMVTHSLAAKMKFNIEEDTYLPFFFDFVAYNLINNEALKEHIDTKGIVIYRKGWRECKLGEVVQLIGGGTPKTTVKEYWNGDISWLSVNDFNTGVKYVSKTEKTITKKGLDNSSTKILDIGDIIISARGTVGATAVLKHPMAFNQSCYGIKSIPGVTVQDFLYYLVKDSIISFQQIAHGGVFDTITRDTFNSIDILLPPISEQRAIASVLSSLDDKIDLLHRQNKTLEAMAGALFRQWFVEKADEAYIVQISDLVEFNPARNIFKGTLAPYLEMANVNTDVFHPIDWYDREFNSGTKFVNGDTLLARITPCLENGKSTYVTFLREGQVGWGSTEFIVMRSKNNLHPLFSYILSKNSDFRDYAKGCLEGSSGRQRVNVDYLSKFEIGIPAPSCIDIFNEVLSTIEKKIHYNFKQIRTLGKLRNTLLPKLISGKARVEND